ncbi:hypothetical protein YC2023_011920 [Brassica napus]
MSGMNFISNLKPKKSLWKIRVKVLKLWKQYSAAGGETSKMLRRTYDCNKKHMLLVVIRLLRHLVNQRVVRENIAVELFHMLLDDLDFHQNERK